MTANDYKSDEDPKTFKSAKTGRGPLTTPDWKNSVDPVMTCYKLVTVEFKWWGLQGKVESFIMQTERRHTFFSPPNPCLFSKEKGMHVETH